MSQNTYAQGWKRVLERADIPHVGTHGVRHRATTEIANWGVPVKVGMQLTAHRRSPSLCVTFTQRMILSVLRPTR
jgi:integrase